MIKSKTKMSTLIVAIVTIATILLGAMFVAGAFKPATNNTVKAATLTASDTGWEYYDTYNNYQDDFGECFGCDPNDTSLYGVLVITDKSVVETDRDVEDVAPWVEYSSNIRYVFFNCNTAPTEIGAYVFYGLEYVEVVKLPNGVETVDEYAFYYCGYNSGLILYVPGSITSDDTCLRAEGGSSDCLKIIIFDGTEEEWEEKEISVTFNTGSDQVFDEGDLTINELSSYYRSNNSLPNSANVIFLQTESTPEDPEPVDPDPVDPEPEDPTPAPATGIELNIGVAVLSLALVGTLFVTVRRKEER